MLRNSETTNVCNQTVGITSGGNKLYCIIVLLEVGNGLDESLNSPKNSFQVCHENWLGELDNLVSKKNYESNGCYKNSLCY